MFGFCGDYCVYLFDVVCVIEKDQCCVDFVDEC